ncbi:MAG: phage terminase small subunit P27 family [Nitrospiraceae bacterium]
MQAGCPDPPDYLTDDAKEEWARIIGVLEPVRVLTVGDFGIVLVACDAYAQLRQCTKFLEEKKSLSYVGTTQNGDEIYRPYPEVAQRNQARRQYISALSELGLTPSSRSKVKSIPDASPQGVGKFLGAS